jgi:hypothetical protein
LSPPTTDALDRLDLDCHDVAIEIGEPRMELTAPAAGFEPASSDVARRL